MDAYLRALLSFEAWQDIENDQILDVVGFTVSLQKHRDSQEDGIGPLTDRCPDAG